MERTGIKLTQSNTNICILKSYLTIEELLNKELLYSKSYLKKVFKKNFLSKEIREKDELYLPLELLNKGLINPVYDGPTIKVLKDTDDFIIVSKPSGTHGHPQTYLETNTVLNFLRNKYSLEELGSFQTRDEATLLYRLDHETSGVLFFSKKSEAYEKIRGEFSNSAKSKEYLAIVVGDFNAEGLVEHDLTPFGKKGAVMKASDPTSESVRINVKKVSYNKDEDVSLLKVELGKGARHQIRAQLSAIGFPILGDSLYGGKNEERIFLHAYRYNISFEGKNITCSSSDEKLFFRFFDLNSCL